MDFENATNATGMGDTGQVTRYVVAIIVSLIITFFVVVISTTMIIATLCIYQKKARYYNGVARDSLTDIDWRPTPAAVIQDDREPVGPLREISISPESDAVNAEEPADPDPANTGMNNTFSYYSQQCDCVGVVCWCDYNSLAEG